VWALTELSEAAGQGFLELMEQDIAAQAAKAKERSK
jgi:hypothetical protein